MAVVAVVVVLVVVVLEKQTERFGANGHHGWSDWLRITGETFVLPGSDGSVENFKRRRATELKHGRIATLLPWGFRLQGSGVSRERRSKLHQKKALSLLWVLLWKR